MSIIDNFIDMHGFVKKSRLNRSGIAAMQEKRFRRLLRYTVANSEFYRTLYKRIDVEKCRLQDLPIMTKSHMMNNFDLLVTDNRIKLEEVQEWKADENNDGKLYLGKFIPILTSGTTGENGLVIYERRAMEHVLAAIYVRTPLDGQHSSYDFFRRLLLGLLGDKDRLAVLAVPGGNLYAFITHTRALHRLFVKIEILPVFDPVEKIVEKLNVFQPTRLVSFASLFPILAREQIAGRLRLAFDHPGFSLVGCGETLTEQAGILGQKAWKTQIQNLYGAVECGFMAASCKQFGNLHTMSDLCILEIVDRNYQPVPRGEFGDKVLLTNLFNFVQPIVRYEIGDMTGYAKQRCKCGLPFTTMLPVPNRIKDIFYFRNPQGGYVSVAPHIFMAALHRAYAIYHYRLTQTQRNELTLHYVSDEDPEELAKQLSKIMGKALKRAGIESFVTIKLNRVESIPRDERSGKFGLLASLGEPPDLHASSDG